MRKNRKKRKEMGKKGKKEKKGEKKKRNGKKGGKKKKWGKKRKNGGKKRLKRLRCAAGGYGNRWIPRAVDGIGSSSVPPDIPTLGGEGGGRH